MHLEQKKTMCAKKTNNLINLNLRSITMILTINFACKRNLNMNSLLPHDGYVQSKSMISVNQTSTTQIN